MAQRLLDAIGGPAGCRKLAESFYSRVDREPLLRPFFPGKNHRCAIEAMASFLVQFLGGPAEETQDRWYLSLRESHDRFPIEAKHREAWMRQMSAALDDSEIAEPARSELRSFFEESGRYIAKEKTNPTTAMGKELSSRWEIQKQLDEAVRQIHMGQSPVLEQYSPSQVTGLLAVMIRNGLSVREHLERDPSLIQIRYFGRTLLHEAAAAGDAETVRALLKLGMDPNVLDGGRHTPLYSLGNGGGGPRSSKVVHLLVKAGAKVNACAGVKRCTPLHMAARRGNVEIAQALLDCGADPAARDKDGVTPLKRALNCRKREIAALLATV